MSFFGKLKAKFSKPKEKKEKKSKKSTDAPVETAAAAAEGKKDEVHILHVPGPGVSIFFLQLFSYQYRPLSANVLPAYRILKLVVG
jgi:hypothetical protein